MPENEEQRQLLPHIQVRMPNDAGTITIATSLKKTKRNGGVHYGFEHKMKHTALADTEV